MEQTNMNKNINEDMRIEQLQMKLGKMGPPVLIHSRCDKITEYVGRTAVRIIATKTIQAFIRRTKQTSTRKIFLSHMERRNRHLKSLETLERQMAEIQKQLEMEKQVMRTTLKIFNKYPKPGE